MDGADHTVFAGRARNDAGSVAVPTVLLGCKRLALSDERDEAGEELDDIALECFGGEGGGFDILEALFPAGGESGVFEVVVNLLDELDAFGRGDDGLFLTLDIFAADETLDDFGARGGGRVPS